MPRIAFVGGPFLSPYGKRGWEYLHRETDYDIVLFESDPARFDLTELDIPIRQLDWLDGRFDLFGYDHFVSRALSSKLHLPTNCLTGINGLVDEFDVIHSVENFNLFSLQAALVCRGTDTAFTFFANQNIPYPPQQRNPLTLLVKRFVNRQAAGIEAVTRQTMRALVHENVDPDKVVVVPYDVDINQFRPGLDVDPEEFGLPPELAAAKNVLFVHELAKRKGIVDIVTAFVTVADDFPDANLILVGADNLGDSLPEEVARRIARQIREHEAIYWIETVKHGDMPRLYNLATLFALPSVTVPTWEEQFGIAVLEAMACGLPTIVSDSGALSYVVDEGTTSLVVPERSPSDLAGAFRQLLSDAEKRIHFGDNGRSRAVSEFSPAGVAERHVAFFDEVLDR